MGGLGNDFLGGGAGNDTINEVRLRFSLLSADLYSYWID
jgi:Ca2+-binding RTX toxin-like protein